MTNYDALIFDMDGTLWDAVDSYCRVWNVTFAEIDSDRTISREELMRCMGMPIGRIYDTLVKEPIDRKRFLRQLDRNEELLMPVLGGTVYPGVNELIPELAQRYPLYMVSNCGALGLVNFLRFTGLAPYFTDTLTYGQTLLAKDGNIGLLRQRHGFKAPVYIGDTQGDCTMAHRAGADMIHAAYGFGTAPDAEYQARSFAEVAKILL